MNYTLKAILHALLIVLSLSFFAWRSMASEAACFPISQAAHDNECYGFEKAECLDRTDIYSCGWGESKEAERVPAADDTRVCETARCSEQYDDEEDGEI